MEELVPARSAPRTSEQTARDRRADIVLDLYEAYYERVYCFLRRMLPADAAEDLAQETFVRLLGVENLERMTLSVSYLLKVAQNLVKRRYARAVRYREILEERVQEPRGELDEEPPESGCVVDAATLDRAFGVLSPSESSAVRMIVCEGLSYAETATALGVSVTTVNNWKHRGLKKLREFVHDNNGRRELESVGAAPLDPGRPSGRGGDEQGARASKAAGAGRAAAGGSGGRHHRAAQAG